MKAHIDKSLATRFAATACEALTREYPNHLTHFLNGEEDARTPRQLHPAFYGALDWHSAVHNHWMLARLVRLFPKASFVPQAREVLEKHLTPELIKEECKYFMAPGRALFERPYGWAWLLTLDTELADFPAQRNAIAPLVTLIAERIPGWLDDLPYPVRSGEHANSAFSLTLMHDWAVENHHEQLVKQLELAARRFYAEDRDASLAFEPSGQDFVSPLLSEAALMTRILAPEPFADWLSAFLSDHSLQHLQPATPHDSEDYKLAHLGGLNLSRAWMLKDIERYLPDDDSRHDFLGTVMMHHQDAGLAAALLEDYGASHWIPSFAVYLLSSQ